MNINALDPETQAALADINRRIDWLIERKDELVAACEAAVSEIIVLHRKVQNHRGEVPTSNGIAVLAELAIAKAKAGA